MSKNHISQEIIARSYLNFVKGMINKKDCFGLSAKQYTKFKEFLNEAKLNLNSNEFPGFIFNNGFIEHFTITSSLENRKGSKQKRKSNTFKNKMQENFLRNLNKVKTGELLSNSYNQTMEVHSHCNIKKSIKTIG